MSAEYASSVAADCRRRAEAMLRSADFVEARLGRFHCICVHDDGHVHVYDQADAHREFGASGWDILYAYEGNETLGKLVEFVRVTFRRPVQHAFTPSLPLL